MDTKPVLTLSNFHDPQARGFVSRWSKEDGTKKKVPVPKQLEDYEANMKGVHLCDQTSGGDHAGCISTCRSCIISAHLILFLSHPESC
jgi:hypothetical protein